MREFKLVGGPGKGQNVTIHDGRLRIEVPTQMGDTSPPVLSQYDPIAPSQTSIETYKHFVIYFNPQKKYASIRYRLELFVHSDLKTESDVLNALYADYMGANNTEVKFQKERIGALVEEHSRKRLEIVNLKARIETLENEIRRLFNGKLKEL